MPTDLKQHFSDIASNQVPLWIDAWEYGRQLLNGGSEIAWDDIGEAVSYHRKLQGLINSDVLAIEVGAFYNHWLSHHSALKGAMKEKRRLGYALRTLLADSAAKQQLREIVDALCDSYPDTPVVLVLPSPRKWMEDAYCYSRDCDSVEVSWEDAESASMYLADYLRSFSGCAISAILLNDNPGQGPTNSEELQAYQPVINVADHYRWQIVLKNCDSQLQADDGGITFALADSFGTSTGKIITQDNWKSGTPANFEGKGFLYIEIPSEAVPEEVLDELARLRAKGG